MEETKSIKGPLVSIPRFSQQESLEIEKLFRDHQINYEKHSAQLNATPTGGYHEYIFAVPQANFVTAIELLKEHFGIAGTRECFTGTCPSCGSKVVKVTECTFCGLALGSDYREALRDHPFMIFLIQSKLIELPNKNELNTHVISSAQAGRVSEADIGMGHPKAWILRIGHGIASLIFIGFSILLTSIIFTDPPPLNEWYSWLAMIGVLSFFLLLTFAVLKRTFERY